MSLLAAHGDWLHSLRARAEQPPRRPRQPLWWEGLVIGSVERATPGRLSSAWTGAGTLPVRKAEQGGTAGWEVHGELSGALALLAGTLRQAGLAHVWRDEQLAVTAPDGRVLGTVERAVVRPLGIPTRAVHLVGFAADGSHWVQQRSFTKANDPGLWDTLMGGMVPACDSLAQALARETWEEAGLRIDQLQALERGGCVALRRPAGDAQDCGYVVETIDWFRCVVPDGVTPENQDGEVAQFVRVPPADLVQRLLAGEFTLEAALILAETGL